MIAENYKNILETASEELEKACRTADCTYNLEVLEQSFENGCIRTYILQGTKTYNLGELYLRAQEIIHIKNVRTKGKETSKTCLKKIIEELIRIIDMHKQNGKTVSITGLQHFSEYLIGGRKIPKIYHSDLNMRIEDLIAES